MKAALLLSICLVFWSVGCSKQRDEYQEVFSQFAKETSSEHAATISSELARMESILLKQPRVPFLKSEAKHYDSPERQMAALYLLSKCANQDEYANLLPDVRKRSSESVAMLALGYASRIPTSTAFSTIIEAVKEDPRLNVITAGIGLSKSRSKKERDALRATLLARLKDEMAAKTLEKEKDAFLRRIIKWGTGSQILTTRDIEDLKKYGSAYLDRDALESMFGASNGAP